MQKSLTHLNTLFLVETSSREACCTEVTALRRAVRMRPTRVLIEASGLTEAAPLVQTFAAWVELVRLEYVERAEREQRALNMAMRMMQPCIFPIPLAAKTCKDRITGYRRKKRMLTSRSTKKSRQRSM